MCCVETARLLGYTSAWQRADALLNNSSCCTLRTAQSCRPKAGTQCRPAPHRQPTAKEGRMCVEPFRCT